jgi:dephospho-CoA kinase
MGKSTTAEMFRDQGVPVWDADAAVHRLYAAGGAAVPGVAGLVPGAVRDGAVDRAALREVLEADPALFPRLEAVVHPLVAEDRARFLRGARASVVVLDVPLLFERGIEGECDGVAVVSAPPETQMARLLARPGMDRAAAAMLLARQVPDGEKRARATWVIPTETLDGARAAVRQVLSAIRARQGEAT